MDNLSAVNPSGGYYSLSGIIKLEQINSTRLLGKVCVLEEKKNKEKLICLPPWHFVQNLAPHSLRPYSLPHYNCQGNSNYKRAHRPDSICF